jgi:hypothetical protein
MMMLVIGLCVGGVLLLGGGATLAWYFLSGLGGGLNEALTFAPDGVQTVGSVRLDDLMNSQVYKMIQAENPNLKVNVGLEDSDSKVLLNKGVVQVIFMNSANSADSIVYIKFRQTVTPDEVKSAGIRKSRNYTESTVGKFKVYEAPGQAFCLVNGTTLVEGRKDALKKVLQRSARPTLSKELERAIAEAGWGKSMALASADAKSNNLGLPTGKKVDLDGLEAMAGTIDVGTEFRASVVGLCRDPQSAENIRKQVDDGLNTLKTLAQAVGTGPGLGGKPPPAELVEVLNSVKIAASGSKVTGEITIKGETISKSMRGGGGGVMPFPLGAPF